MINPADIGFARVSVVSDDSEITRSPGPSPTRVGSVRRSLRSDRLCSSCDFLQEQLQWLVFSGVYQERRYIPALQDYRDVVLVDAVEKKAIKKLKELIKYCKQELDEFLWIGMKKSSAGVRLFVELDDGTEFGHYWFLVTTVRLTSHHEGLQLSVRCLRPLAASDLADCVSKPATAPVSESPSGGQFYNSLTLAVLQGLPWKNLADLIKQVFSFRSLRELAQFVCMSVLLLLSSLRHVHVWLLQLMDCSGVFVERCTPLLESIMGFLLKLFGGVLMLLSQIWRDLWHWRGTHQSEVTTGNMIQMSSHTSRRPLPLEYTSNSHYKHSPSHFQSSATASRLFRSDIDGDTLLLARPHHGSFGEPADAQYLD